MTENINEIAPEEREAESDDGEITFEQIMYLVRQSMLRNYPNPDRKAAAVQSRFDKWRSAGFPMNIHFGMST